jgi:hypothetical protein
VPKRKPIDLNAVKVGDRVVVPDDTEYGELENHQGQIVSILPKLVYPLGVRVAGIGVLSLRADDVILPEVA